MKQRLVQYSRARGFQPSGFATICPICHSPMLVKQNTPCRLMSPERILCAECRFQALIDVYA